MRRISIDVECVATGKGHSDLAPCRVALVDPKSHVSWSAIIHVSPILNPMTSITGLTEADIETNGRPFADVRADLVALLGPDVVLVGQNIDNDIGWMQLEAGTHFAKSIDLAEEFRVWNPRFKNYLYSSLRKEVYAAFDTVVEGVHDPAVDATWSLRLGELLDGPPSRLAKIRKRLLDLTCQRRFPSVLTGKVTFDGLCQFAFEPARCRCGQPTLSKS